MTETCDWAGQDPDYLAYHDTQWGVPVRDSRNLWENLCLESFQSGLSWLVILRKREGFRTAFAGFDPEIVARWGEPEIDRLVLDAGIVRHRGKIAATLGNARAMLDIEAGPGFANYLWDRVDGVPLQNNWKSLSEVPGQTPLSVALSKDLKARGFKFCGPTVVYAFLQASGLVNDHLVGCPRHAAVAQMAQPPIPRA